MEERINKRSHPGIRLLACVVTLLILTAMLLLRPVRARAAGIIDAGDYVYQVMEDGQSVKIIQYKGQSLYVSLPSTVEEYTVTAVGSAAFMSNTTIKEMELSSSINLIEANAFYKCTSLQKLQIPGNVLGIGECAFMDCISLQSVTIYDGTAAIGPYAFSGCTALTELKLPNSLKLIDEFAFFNCTSLAEVSIPKSVDEFGGHMLEGTKWMQNQKTDFVVVGDGVLIQYNGKEKSKSIPKNIKKIGAYAFAENDQIDTILLSDSVSKIGKNAFHNCKNLKTVSLPNSLSEIEEEAFAGCESLEKAELPSSISKIDAGTFRNCRSLRSIQIPPSISVIRNEAFQGCSGLREVKLQNGIQTIESMVFDHCDSLGRLIFPESLKELGYSAVSECPSLTRMEFNGDTTLCSSSVFECSHLHEVVFYKNPTNVEDMAFAGSRDLTLYSDNSLYVEEYARRNKLGSENIRNLKPYTDEGVLKAEEKQEQSGFSGPYTLIVIIIILVDLALIILFSLYILFVQPKGRHSRTGKSRHSSGRYSKANVERARASTAADQRTTRPHPDAERKRPAKPTGTTHRTPPPKKTDRKQ